MDTINKDNTQRTPPGSPEAAAQQQKLDMAKYFPTTANSAVNVTPDATAIAGVKGINVPQPVKNTVYGNNLSVSSGIVSGGATTDTKAADAAAKEDVTSKGVLSKLYGLIGQQAEKGAYKQSIQEEQDITGKTKAVNDVNKNILLTTQSYDQKIKDIRGSGGLTKVQAAAQIEGITRQKDEHLANLGIQKAVALGDLDTANKIVDDKVSAKFEPIDNQIKSLEQLYTLAQNDMSESEKVAAQLKIQEKKDQADAIKNAYADVLKNASASNAPVAVLQAIDAAAANPNATAGSIYAAAGKYAGNNLDNVYKELQIKKLENELSSSGDEDASQLIAYAQQYASTGTIPTGLPKGTFGKVAEVAKELPKVTGEIVDNNTGIRPAKMTAAQIDSYSALRDLTNKLDAAKEMFGELSTGIVAGTFKSVFPTDAQQKYDALRSEIVDLLARARTGAAITAFEEKSYLDKIPGKFNNSFFVGSSGLNKIQSLRESIAGKLDSGLRANGSSMYGFSKVNVGGKEYTVGDIIEINGKTGRINPDGSVTTI